jgi:hypothetical protein
MRGAVIVISSCLVISVVLAFFLRHKFTDELVASQDLMLGLIYFMEQHGGRLPDSEAEFRAAEFVEELPGGGVRIRAPRETRYQPRTHGYPIRDLAPFRVRWGTDLTTLTPDDYHNLRNPAGEKVQLVRWPASPPSGKGYSLILASTARDIRERAAASAPALPAGGDESSAEVP